MRDISNKTHRAEHEIYSFCAKERDLGNIGQMRKSKIRWEGVGVGVGGGAAPLNCLASNMIASLTFKNTVDLSNVHIKGVRFLKDWGNGGEGRGRSAVWENNFSIRENGKNVFPNDTQMR